MAERPTDAPLRAPLEEIERLESLLRAGWPALEVEADDGWLLGASGRDSRRANSVAPIGEGQGAVGERIARAERFYRERGLTPVFKMTTAARPSGLDTRLAERGYDATDETIVMTRSLERGAAPERSADRTRAMRVIHDRIDEAWLDASVEASGLALAKRGDYRAILERVIETASALFVGLEDAGALRSLAFGALVGETVSLARVATLPDWRGRHLAEQVTLALLEASRARGARLALLSVEADNASALRLYQRLGFVERYRYWYREAAFDA